MKYATRKILRGFGWLFVALGVLYLVPSIFPSLGENIYAQVVLLIIGILCAVALKHLNNTWLQGEHGEMDVEDELKKLTQGFYCLGSHIIKGPGNIDNIVVGPTGVWVLEVKSHRRFDYQFFMRRVVNQVWARAFSVRDVLKGKIWRESKAQPVVVYSSKKVKLWFHKDQVRGCYVVGIKQLGSLIQNTVIEPLQAEEVERIKTILKPYQEK